MKNVIEQINSRTVIWCVILFMCLILNIVMYAFYISNITERRCIASAEKMGTTTDEIKKWCRDVF